MTSLICVSDAKSSFVKSGLNEIIADGQLELSEFNDYFKSHLISKSSMLTIGGWLIEHLGEIPENGFKCESEGFLFQVLSADPNRIKRLFIRKRKK